MTLVLTMFAKDGIYQSSDNRLSLPSGPCDDDAVKHLALVCTDGAALIGFTGLAKAPNGQHMIEWLRESAVGEAGSVQQTLTAIGWRATREIGGSPYRGCRLEIVAGAYTQEGPKFVTIDNQWVRNSNGAPVVRREFYQVTFDVPTCRTYPAGSGTSYVSAADVALLSRCAGQKPRSYENYLRLLATVTRRAAAEEERRSGKQTVSPRCYTANMPTTVWPLRGQTWHELPSALSRRMRPIPTVVGGVDVTANMHELVERQTTGHPLGVKFVFGPADIVNEADPDWRRRTKRSRRRTENLYR